MSLGRQVLAEVAPDTGQNPLGLLGLSQQILSLGLSDAELYSVSKRLAKGLLAEVHEDRVTPTERTRYLQARFSQAMNALKNEQTFALALAELNQEASAERGASARARRDSEDLRAEVGRLQNELLTCINQRSAERQIIGKLRQDLAARMTLVDVARRKAEAACFTERQKVRKELEGRSLNISLRGMRAEKNIRARRQVIARQRELLRRRIKRVRDFRERLASEAARQRELLRRRIKRVRDFRERLAGKSK